jgi:hypothetical protein
VVGGAEVDPLVALAAVEEMTSFEPPRAGRWRPPLDAVAALGDAALRELVAADAETRPDVERAVRVRGSGTLDTARSGFVWSMVDDDLRTRR